MKSSTSQPTISSSGYPKRRSKAGLQSWTLLLESSTTLASGLFSTMAVRKALRSPIRLAVRSRGWGWLSVFIAGAVISGESCPAFRDADLPFLRLARTESTLIGIEFVVRGRHGAIARRNLSSNRAHICEKRSAIYGFQKPTPDQLFSVCRGGTAIVPWYRRVSFRQRSVAAGCTKAGPAYRRICAAPDSETA